MISIKAWKNWKKNNWNGTVREVGVVEINQLMNDEIKFLFSENLLRHFFFFWLSNFNWKKIQSIFFKRKTRFFFLRCNPFLSLNDLFYLVFFSFWFSKNFSCHFAWACSPIGSKFDCIVKKSSSISMIA